MNRLNSNILSIGITSLLVIVVVLSSLVTSHIVDKFEREEQKKIELWAEATRQFILAGENENIDLILQIMEGNTTIPVYMVDTNYNLLLSRNVVEPKRHVEKFYAKKINELRATQEPIEVRISDNVMQYIYYEPSSTLQWLALFPYIQLIVMLALAGLAAIALLMVQRSEQNSLWVGLSKETAHQLGTPISSLMAWTEILKESYPDDTLIPEMDKDVKRLQLIADRFSKIGSLPEPVPSSLNEVMNHVIDYMDRRTSKKVRMIKDFPDHDVIVRINASLFEWVIENLSKNAVDAMGGESGTITLHVEETETKAIIEVSDTGKGIRKKDISNVFRPGFTTKKRGWGLGLSLAKRIVEEYHHGHIFVKSSEVGVGTTFRIELRK